jgi:rhamnosyltransferase
MKKPVCAVITAFNSDDKITETIRSIEAQVAQVVVVDDGSEEASFRQVEMATRNFPDVVLIRNTQNYGLGKTLNIGAEYAVKEGYEWMLTLDDNSKANENMVEEMFAAYDRLPSKRQEKTAIIAPNYTTLKGVVYPGDETSIIETTITAGQLVKTVAWKQFGGFNEELIIGAIDHDFAFKAREAGYDMLLVPSAILHETPGPHPIVRSLFGKKFIVPNYSSKRYYYIYRNDIYLYKKYALTVPVWTFQAIISNIASFMKIIIFEPNRRQKTMMICRGCWDGLRGNLGKIA